MDFKNSSIAILALLFAFGCGKDSEKGKSTGTRAESAGTETLRKSDLSEKDLEDLRTWRFYSRDNEPYAASSPDFIGFSTDGRVHLRVYTTREGEFGTDRCEFHMVSKVDLKDAGRGVFEMKMVGTPEFVFSFGTAYELRDGKPFKVDWIVPEQRARAEELCFERMTFNEVAEALGPNEAYPKVNFGRIESKDDQQITFQSFAPTEREIIPTPKSYQFKRAHVGAWEKEQNCSAPESGCLP